MKHLLFALCLLTSIESLAQFKPRTEREVGYFIHHKDFGEALKLLNKPENVDPKSPSWNFLKGKVFYNLGNHDSSNHYFEIADQLQYQSKEMLFYLGDIYHSKNEFEEAQKYYNRYLEELSENDKDPPADNITVGKRILECGFGAKFKKDPKPIEIENIGSTINSPYPDYAPIISADEQSLFFTSRRPNSVGGLVDARDGWNMEDIYLCIKDSLNQWTKPQQLPGYINTKGHDANIGLSPDGQSLFIYRDDELEAGLAGNIYESIWKYHRWSTPVLLPDPVNTQYWETGVTTTPDENTLYFSSNRPGGFGGLDLYVVRRLPDGSWARPKNLGSTINTKYNEESPFILPDGKTLYFSSQGHSSMGGFDIFTSTLEDSTWSEPENMGYPLNTAQNELYFVLSADARRGYFSGIRGETFGDKDLYIANLPEKPVQIILLKGRVVDGASGKPMATLLKVYDNETKDLVYVLNSNGVNGRFSSVLPPHKNYNIQVDVAEPGYAHYSINIDIPDQKEFIEIDTTIRLNREDTIHVITLLPNIFFKLDLAELDSTSELEIDALAKRLFQNPKMNVEIAVHTYSQKEETKNLNLSQRRAEAIKQALVERGIAGNRIFPVGYGQKFPQEDEKSAWQNEGKTPKDRVEAIIIPSFNEDMKPANDGFYYLNAYKPFVLKPEPEEEEMLAGNSSTKNTSKSTNPPTEQTEINTTDNKPYDSQPKEAEASNTEEKLDLKDLPDLNDLRVYFVVNRIYFRVDPDTVFDRIIKVMEDRPDLDIIINCYTDTVGHPDYNVFLSKIRADNVKKAMVKKGADPDRIKTVGHGEKNPIYSNATREGRMKNRRAEFQAVQRKN